MITVKLTFKDFCISIGIILIIFVMLLEIVLSYDKWDYHNEMWTLLLSFIPFSLIFIVGITFKGVKILHPYLMVSILYFFLFILSPIISIYWGETKCHGDFVMDGCIKGTYIFLIGFACFTIGYLIPKDTRIRYLRFNPLEKDKKIIIILCYVIWLIGAISCMYYIYKSSVALTALFTNDTMRIMAAFKAVDNSSLKFLANFAYFMVFPCVVLAQMEKHKSLFYCILILTLFLFYLRGTRIFIVVLIMAYLIVFIRVKNYRIRFYQIVVFLFLFLVMISYLGTNRNYVKMGLETVAIEKEDVLHALATNLDIYKPYYGLVANCPDKVDYTYGNGMFVDSFVSLIPRFLWPNKRVETPMTNMISKTTGNGPLRAGMSWPNISEFYMDFGILGVVIFNMLFGFLVSKSIKWLNSSSLTKVMVYAILFPTYFQLVIRGYTPINFIMYLCLFFPYILVSPFFKIKKQ